MPLTADLDLTPRYAPSTVLVFTTKGPRELPVLETIAHPPGAHPVKCPIARDWTALELRTEAGSRWFGCQSAHINSELRMVVIGTPPRDEVRMRWPVCNQD